MPLTQLWLPILWALWLSLLFLLLLLHKQNSFGVQICHSETSCDMQCYWFSLHSISWINIWQMKLKEWVVKIRKRDYCIISQVITSQSERKMGFTSIWLLLWRWVIQTHWRHACCSCVLISCMPWTLWWCMLRCGGRKPVYWQLTIFLLHCLSKTDQITTILNIICMYRTIQRKQT